MNNLQKMIEEYRVTAGQEKNPEASADYFLSEILEWREEFFSKENPEAEFKEMLDVIYTAIGYVNAKGWDLEEGFKRVHENNMGRMYQDDGTILRADNGKILKNKNYPKVNLGDLV